MKRFLYRLYLYMQKVNLELRRLAGERAARFAVYDEIRARNPDVEPEHVAADVAAAVRAVREDGR